MKRLMMSPQACLPHSKRIVVLLINRNKPVEMQFSSTSIKELKGDQKVNLIDV